MRLVLSSTAPKTITRIGLPCAIVRHVARTKSRQERGALGDWARTARLQASLSTEQVVERLAARGYRVHAATLRRLEAKSEGGEELIRALAELYGVEPPPRTVTEPPIERLIRALEAQTASITRLVEALAEMTENERQERALLFRSLAALGARVATSRPAADAEPAAPAARD